MSKSSFEEAEKSELDCEEAGIADSHLEEDEMSEPDCEEVEMPQLSFEEVSSSIEPIPPL